MTLSSILLGLFAMIGGLGAWLLGRSSGRKTERISIVQAEAKDKAKEQLERVDAQAKVEEDEARAKAIVEAQAKYKQPSAKAALDRLAASGKAWDERNKRR